MDGAGGTEVTNGAGEAVAGVARGIGMDFLWGRFGGRAAANMHYLAAEPGSAFAGLADSGVRAVDGERQDAENVLHGERESGADMLFQLGERDEHVALLVGRGEVVAGEEVASVRDHEAGIAAVAEGGVRIDEFDVGSGVKKIGGVPTGSGDEGGERA